jgi:hypothetical protein
MSSDVTRHSRVDQLPQRGRRIVAVATLLGLPAMYAWSSFWMGTSVPNIIWGPVSFVLIGVTLVGAVVIYRFARDRADLRDDRLDERERMLRDRAWILSYQVLAVVVVALVAAVTLPVLAFGQAIVIDAGLATALALCLGVLLPVLPAAALAWLEPDALEDD